MSPVKRGAGRPSMIDDPAFAKIVAELFASGLGREPMLDELQGLGFDVRDKDTITRWRRDPRIKALVGKLIEDRAIQISRKIDAVIEGRLAHAEKLEVRDLIAIRKEYGGTAVQRKEIADDNVTAAAIEKMENDPEFIKNFEALLEDSVPA